MPRTVERKIKVMRQPIIVAVTGGRYYKDRKRVYAKLDKYHAEMGFTHLIHGDAIGLDTLANDWCDTKRGVQSVACRAHWNRDKKGAGPIRNDMMAILKPIRLFSFPGGVGTAHMTELCRSYGIRVTTIKE